MTAPNNYLVVALRGQGTPLLIRMAEAEARAVIQTWKEYRATSEYTLFEGGAVVSAEVAAMYYVGDAAGHPGGAGASDTWGVG